MSQPVNFYWRGPPLGPLELACMQSFHRHGHPVILHAYERPENLPAFAEWLDAEQVMPKSDILSPSKTSWQALTADRYRLRLIEAGCGLYADCDVFCLSPIEDADYIFGWEYLGSVNNAVLKFPPGSALSKRMLEFVGDEYFVPPWLRRRERAWLHLRRALGMGKHVGAMPWGTWSPIAMSYALRELGLEDKAQPVDVFYPFPGMHFDLLFDPGLSLADLITPRTKAIHLWNNMYSILGRDRTVPPPPGSPLDEVLRSYEP